LRKLLQLDWDIIAGITAAVLAIVLHLLHIVEHDVLLTIVLVLLALLLFRDLRRESHDGTSRRECETCPDEYSGRQARAGPTGGNLLRRGGGFRLSELASTATRVGLSNLSELK
jgi:hypothetical protein